jgi:DNA invertase Pin-like site-specific DNA recombinase
MPMDNYVIAKYIRLSRDDAVTDSLSIPNQRALLDRHIGQMGIDNETVLEFVDNGYTGTNYERPAVQEMLDMARNGGIHCIVCKDFSRFGRNIIETGYFIEQVFPMYGIRFIAVTDGYDSADYKGDTGGIDVAFKFLIHEYYSKDLSAKVKSALKIRMNNGESLAVNPTYHFGNQVMQMRVFRLPTENLHFSKFYPSKICIFLLTYPPKICIIVLGITSEG